MEEVRRRLTARRKFDLYLETRAKDANVGEILRRWGVHLNDLRQIEAVVEKASVEALTTGRNGTRRGAVSAAEYGALERELAEKDSALSAIASEYALLKKSERSGLSGRLNMSTSTGRHGRV
jgi:hypothetical protein